MNESAKKEEEYNIVVLLTQLKLQHIISLTDSQNTLFVNIVIISI